MRRLESRVEAGLARVEERLGEIDTAVGKLAGAVVPLPKPPHRKYSSPYPQSPPRFGGNPGVAEEPRSGIGTENNLPS